MFSKSGVTAKFLVAITLAILVIQTGSGVVSLVNSRNNQSQQADSHKAALAVHDKAACHDQQTRVPRSKA